MSNRVSIDKLFKSQLTELPVASKEKLWQRMEQQLDAEQPNKGSGKRYSLLLLLLMGVVAGIYVFSSKNGRHTVQASIANNARNAQLKKNVSQVATSNALQQRQLSDNTVTTGKPNNSSTLSIASTSFADVGIDHSLVPYSKNALTTKGPQRVNIQSSQPETLASVNEINDVTDEITNSVAVSEKPAPTEKAFISKPETTVKSKSVEKTAKKKEKAAQTTSGKKAEKKNSSDQRISIGAAGGMDLFLKSRETGYYGGLQITIPLNKKVNLVTGLQVSSHKMEENYSNAEKQRINPDKNIDAKLQGLTVLQVPVLYELPLPGNKVKFRAGLTPTYIINAGIYNVPNSFNGNVANYRKFTLDDLHRLNVLFTAGIGVKVTKNIELELKGNYGLTELVKNSYINQSSVNNNFKSAQVGIIINPFKKKK